MTTDEIATHAEAVAAALPESAVSARIILGLLLGEIVARELEIDRLKAELEKRPGFRLLQGGAA